MQIQILKACDHNIIERDVVLESVILQRSDSKNIDTFPTGISNILGINSIMYTTPNGAVTLSPEIYYLYNDTLIWRYPYKAGEDGVYGTPSPGSTFAVSTKYMKASLTKYLDYNCPRCRGTGWYLDILPDGETLETISGPKLAAQDFIKMLLTPTGDDRLDQSYGSTLIPSIGVNYFDSKLQTNVSASVSLAESRCREAQLKELWRTEDEIIDKVIINSITPDVDNGLLYIVLTIMTVYGTQIQFGMNI